MLNLLKELYYLEFYSEINEYLAKDSRRLRSKKTYLKRTHWYKKKYIILMLHVGKRRVVVRVFFSQNMILSRKFSIKKSGRLSLEYSLPDFFHLNSLYLRSGNDFIKFDFPIKQT